MPNTVTIECPEFDDELNVTFLAKGSYTLTSYAAPPNQPVQVRVECTLAFPGGPDPIVEEGEFTDGSWEIEIVGTDWTDAELTARLYDMAEPPNLLDTDGPVVIDLDSMGALDCR